MQKLAHIYEEFIRADPEQWHMFQPIWTDLSMRERSDGVIARKRRSNLKDRFT